MKSDSYKKAGVDIELADEFLEDISELVKKTYTTGVVNIKKGFSGLFHLGNRANIFIPSYKDLVIAGCCDGVGTKLKIAFATGIHNTVGIDLVAMNINDLLCHGCKPLFFMDYIATGKINKRVLLEVMKGISDGCIQAQVALLGGETAEMPGFYKKDEYDLAGFAIGMVERKKIIAGKYITPGDVIIGLGSNGLHSNGFSLVRKILVKSKKSLKKVYPELRKPLYEELLRPTKIYTRAILGIMKNYRKKNIIKGMAHITGGGMYENIKRILPSKVDAYLSISKELIPPIFSIIQKEGKISSEEMYSVFNMGIGFVLIVNPFFADSVIEELKIQNEKASIIGEIKKGTGRVIIEGVK